MRSEYSDVEYPGRQITGLIIASAYEVHRVFGFGFLESVYKRAMAAEVRFRGAKVGREVRFDLSLLLQFQRSFGVAQPAVAVSASFCVAQPASVCVRRRLL